MLGPGERGGGRDKRTGVEAVDGGGLIQQGSECRRVPGHRASAWAAEGRSWGLIWPSWRKQAIRVQLVQTEVK